ncbi:hypothetical protein BURMUCF2_2651 [Burkholderia multivorans CF2]|nr:hypothetical protein BURMUCGD1_0605 [Burkholderia multivorans CGD1]EJO62778.1 hypothetical protein BURMUCF2_2651 [Burkholderia multivorans CF2]
MASRRLISARTARRDARSWRAPDFSAGRRAMPRGAEWNRSRRGGAPRRTDIQQGVTR